MARPLLPPRYVNAPASLVYGDLPRSIIVTGLRIWGLGWQHEYKRTGRIPIDALCELCGLSRTQLYEHLARLVATGVLRYTNIDGQFTFRFDRGAAMPRDARAGPSPENRTDGTIDVVDVSSSFDESFPHDKQQQQTTHTHAVGGSAEGGAGQSGKPDGRAEILEAMGVLEPTRSRLLALEWTNGRYLSEWLAWYEGQDALGTGWVIMQIRLGTAAPESHRKAAARDRQRYLEWGE